MIEIGVGWTGKMGTWTAVLYKSTAPHPGISINHTKFQEDIDNVECQQDGSASVLIVKRPNLPGHQGQEPEGITSTQERSTSRYLTLLRLIGNDSTPFEMEIISTFGAFIPYVGRLVVTESVRRPRIYQQHRKYPREALKFSRWI